MSRRPGRAPTRAAPRAPRGSELGGEQVEGRRAVVELLAAGRRSVRRVLVAEDQEPAAVLDEIEELARRRRVPVEMIPRPRLDAQARTDSPQGVVAMARPLEPVPLETLCEAGPGGRPPFLLVAAGITDPRNLGALLRSAECAGVTGVVLPRHRSTRLSATVAKTAAGAIEHLSFAVVGGVPAALVQLRAHGVWVVGLAGESEESFYELRLADDAVAVVLGGEEKGLPPLVRRRCDVVAGIPQHGALPSLNVGAAGAVACFEVARQRAGVGSPRQESNPRHLHYK